MKVNYFHNQGTTEFSEDGLIIGNPNFLGVTDGMSAVYLPQKGPKMFHGMTGGQLASNIVMREFSQIRVSGLAESLERANAKLAVILIDRGYDLTDSAVLPGTCFAVAHLREKEIDIIQAEDCLAVWETKNGKKSGTRNQAFECEKSLRAKIAELMRKHERNKEKMWQEFLPILVEARRKSVNKEFAVLNGQQDFEEHWQRIVLNTEELKTMILFTDGFVDFCWTENPEDLAKRLIGYYKVSGLWGILEETREANIANRFSSHEVFPEATALSIEF